MHTDNTQSKNLAEVSNPTAGHKDYQVKDLASLQIKETDVHFSAPKPALSPETLITTNAHFLEAIFTDLQSDERPMVLSISGKIGAGTKWPVGSPWEQGTMADNPELNWFFTLSTYKSHEGKYRRIKKQFHRAFGVYLDDVGTKAAPRERLEACPPSYLIETSAGNYHAGYLFNIPCADLRQVEALQNALVKAGLCDPGANGPSARIGRLPFSCNGKYEPAFHCRLQEWHPERRYSISDIVERLELEPPEPAGSHPKAKNTPPVGGLARNTEADVYVPRSAESAVLHALRQRNLYKRPLGNGTHDITCPWVHEHTGAQDHGTAYFEPSDLSPTGGFKCMHSHGDGKRIGSLLEFLGVSRIDAKHKPTLFVQPGELHRVVDAAEMELAGCGRYYQRGGLIVTVVTDPGTNGTVIKPVSPNALMRALSTRVVWQRYDARSEEFVVIDPPAKHVNVLAESDHYAHLPVLRGIARQPYLRSDGSLMTAAGFDQASGMFGVFDERAFHLPASPSREDACRALAELVALLDEFSFAKPHDRSAALALMLTAAIRPALRTALTGHIKAPQIASGKSYLCDLIAAFADPSKVPSLAFPTTDEECSKLLLSALVEAPAVLKFDNLTTDILPFKSLCSALTDEYLSGRILGVSKTATVSTATLFLSSGNNVDAVQDMARRVLTVTLDPACETPATRRFRGDPLGTVLARREHYVSLALTIVRAYVMAGCPPQQLKPLNGYSDWSRLTRSPLVWLGLPDPASAIFGRMGEDPDRELLHRLLIAWHKTFGAGPVAVREVVDAVECMRTSADPDLCDAVREIADERGTINRRRLGRWVSRHERRIVGNLRVERDMSKSGGSERWRVVTVVTVVSDGPTNLSVPPSTASPEPAF